MPVTSPEHGRQRSTPVSARYRVLPRWAFSGLWFISLFVLVLIGMTNIFLIQTNMRNDGAVKSESWWNPLALSNSRHIRDSHSSSTDVQSSGIAVKNVNAQDKQAPESTPSPTSAATSTAATPPPTPSPSKYKCPVGKRGDQVPILNTATPHVILGVLIRNRKPYVELFAETLRESISKHPELEPYLHVRLYDDDSSEFTPNDLMKLFPMAKRIQRILKQPLANRGGGITDLFTLECSQTTADICVLGDSDTVLNPGWMPKMIHNMNKTDGHLTLYNSCSHEQKQCEGDLCEKGSAGNALSAFARPLLAEIECNLQRDEVNSFDWIWSGYIVRTGRRLFSINPSLGEHIGIHSPSNGDASRREQSRNFDPFVFSKRVSTLLYLHLYHRRIGACDTRKLNPPPGWFIDSNFSLTPAELDYFFLKEQPEIPLSVREKKRVRSLSGAEDTGIGGEAMEPSAFTTDSQTLESTAELVAMVQRKAIEFHQQKGTLVNEEQQRQRQSGEQGP